MAKGIALNKAEAGQKLLDVSCLNLSACFCELRGKDLGIQLGSGKKEALLVSFCAH